MSINGVNSTTANSVKPNGEADKGVQAEAARNTADSNGLYELTTYKGEGFVSRMLDTFFPPKPTPTLDVSVDAQKRAVVKTADGYTLRFSGVRQEWTITRPDGKTTTIWGDPHVDESDGDRWDFVKRSTFVFGNNKVTVETKKLPNGTSLSDTVHVYNGDDRFSITDLEIDIPRFQGWDLDAQAHDAHFADGDVYHLVVNGNDERWIKQ